MPRKDDRYMKVAPPSQKDLDTIRRFETQVKRFRAIEEKARELAETLHLASFRQTAESTVVADGRRWTKIRLLAKELLSLIGQAEQEKGAAE